MDWLAVHEVLPVLCTIVLLVVVSGTCKQIFTAK